jgi:hypothetical protein
MARAIAALGLALLALALAVRAHQSKQTRAFALSPPPELVPGLRASPARADTCLASHGVPWPVYASNVSRPRPRLHPHYDTRRQERILTELFSVIMQADDVALLEREAANMGLAYLDTNFSMCRRPALLRNQVRDIMSKYGIPIIPLERKWTPVNSEPNT